jgi:GT2 family glycosyltransferase
MTEVTFMKIAAILTVHNRKQKTLTCLRHLFDATNHYNNKEKGKIKLSVYLTDDGCTDGTAEAIMKSFPSQHIRILKGTGSLFWAGGMRLAWKTAMEESEEWDYYLLLNDDTNMMDAVFDELFEANSYVLKQTGRQGIISGITCQPGNKSQITYGGFNFVNKTKGRQVLVLPNEVPQRIDLTHANILLVHHSIVKEIGIFYRGYTHGCADIDYSMMAKRHGIPTYSTANVCGECVYDHISQKEEAEHLTTMTLTERKKYVNSPTHCDSDYLLFVHRNLPLRYPLAWLLRTIRVYVPYLYLHITNFRGVYKS